MNSIFNFFPAQKPLKGALSIPHSGQWIPAEFTSYLTADIRALNEDVDTFVHELIDIKKLNEQGIAVLVAQVHRCAVDLNREENMSVLWWEKNTQGIPLTTQKPDNLFKQRCLETYYRPYYKKLQEIAHEFQEAKPFPAIDLHSMPSKPTAYHLQQTPHQAQERPDFCLSDIEGTSCSPSYIHFIAEHLKSYAYNVSINNPYKGGNVTLTMKKMQWQSCQIEIKRSLYMDEKKKELKLNTQTIELKNHLTELFLKLFL